MNPTQANSQYGDKERFNEACRTLCGEVPSRKKIGVLSEKTLHSVIKRFIEPNEALHELKVDGYYADIKNHDGIFEVQTRSFSRLRAKLTSYLETEAVAIALVFNSLVALRFTSNFSIMDMLICHFYYALGGSHGRTKHRQHRV